MSDAERLEKREAVRMELSRKLREIQEEAERLTTLDPLWVFNEVQKIQSLVGQLNDITYRYRRLT